MCGGPWARICVSKLATIPDRACVEELVRASCVPPPQRRRTTARRNGREIQRDAWWALQGLNLRPLPCEGNTCLRYFKYLEVLAAVFHGFSVRAAAGASVTSQPSARPRGRRFARIDLRTQCLSSGACPRDPCRPGRRTCASMWRMTFEMCESLANQTRREE